MKQINLLLIGILLAFSASAQVQYYNNGESLASVRAKINGNFLVHENRLDSIVGTALPGKVNTTVTVNGHALNSNVTVTKADVLLGSVDNTSDANKPVSTAQAAADALNLKIGQNLADLNNTSTARTNLGLGTLATQNGTFSGTSSGTNTGDQDLSGLLVKANNLSDLASVSTARTNLGLGTLATQSGTFSGTSSGTNTGDQDLSTLMVKTNNLSDLTNASTARTNLGLGTLATQSGTFSGTHSGTSSGTNTGDQTISITGDVTASGGTGALSATVTKINGTSLAGLTTGILKNTTGTGVLSIAVAGDFPTLNQNTTGSAALLTTGRTIAITGDLSYTSPSFDGTGNVTAAGTLATVNSNTGSFGSATQSLSVTLDGKGRVTAASAQTVTPAVGSITGLGTGVSTALAVNTGSNGAFVVNGSGQMIGTATNDNATAGNVGERMSNTVSTYTNYTTTATYQNIASVTLTAGDWEVDGFVTFSANSATLTTSANTIIGISTSTGSITGAVEGRSIAYISQNGLVSTSKQSIAIPPFSVKLSTSGTYYLVTQSTYISGNPQYVGGIRAVRVR